VVLFRKKKKTYRLAKKLADYAHLKWMGIFFLIAFFIDAFVIVIPIDGLLCFMLIFAEDQKKKLYVYSLVGFVLGFIAIALLTASTFQQDIIDVIYHFGFKDSLTAILESAGSYGYFNIALGTLTIVAPAICLVSGIIVGLDWNATLMIVIVMKALRLFLMIFFTLKISHIIVDSYESTHPS